MTWGAFLRVKWSCRDHFSSCLTCSILSRPVSTWLARNTTRRCWKSAARQNESASRPARSTTWLVLRKLKKT
ncbi:hypothetical protein S-CBS2_gp098 [Synechococcus phage S-CBS2]|uniref:hypothetical protein n=1 Tax=Synechococcus phage S-CBS2 TaxID=753084 RepID=UPI0002078440|nr:hypothetical protein S-CBS2_gp098 [Synechococcus phage S-CBS2]ADF42454.1 hypothetical protein S-CBS2_gp098 [Synechococcus phage S-CBS2]